MRRPIAIVLLSLGTVVGYSSGFAHLRGQGAWSHCSAREVAVAAPQQPAASPTNVYVSPSFVMPAQAPTPAPAAASAPAPVYILQQVPQPAAAPAPAPGTR